VLEARRAPRGEGRERGGEAQGQVGRGGEAVRRPPGGGEQADEQEGPHGLGGFRRAGAHQSQEADAEEANRDPSCRGDGLVDAGEQQGAGNGKGDRADGGGGDGGQPGPGGAQSGAGAEQAVEARGGGG